MIESGGASRRRKRSDVSLRAWLETRFGDWGRISARHPRPIIGAMVVLGLALAAQLPLLEIDTSTESFLRSDDPTRVVYSNFLEQFGNDQLIVIALRPPEIFESDFIGTLRELHAAVEHEVPYVEEVTSLINVRETRGEGDRLIVGELLEGGPFDEERLAAIRERAFANPLYQGFLLSEDRRTTTLIVELAAFTNTDDAEDSLGGFEEAEGGELLGLTGEQQGEAAAALLTLLDRFRSDALEIHASGNAIMSSRLASEMMVNMPIFMCLSLVAVGVLLFVLFRRLSAVWLPLLVVSLSIVSTFGAMALFGTRLGVPTQILPSFLLAVGVGGSVHLLVVFFRAYDTGESREDALAHALSHSGLAITMTALTTAGGLVSFLAAEVAPVAELGLFAPLGIALGLVYCMVLLPALLHVIPLRRRARSESGWGTRIERILLWVGEGSVRHPRAVLAGLGVILLVSFAGITQLTYSYDPVSWFPSDDPARVATDFVNSELGGAISLEVLVDTGAENGLHEPSVLAGLDELGERSQEIETVSGIRVGHVTSLVGVTKEIHQALNENRADYYAVPKDRRLVAQELLLFENSGADDLEQLVDSGFQQARLTMSLPTASPAFYQPFIARIEALARETLGPDTEVTMTGFACLMTRSLTAISTSLLRSYAIALAIITPLMFLLLGSFRMGMAAMVPNLAPIILILGVMGWLRIPLDTFTLLIGSIAIGLAVDDTIHFMHVFRKSQEKLGDTSAAVRETLRTTGHALLVTSIVLSLSFFVYSFASLSNLVTFGLLTGATILFAFVADITLSPALMALTAPAEPVAAHGSERARRAPRLLPLDETDPAVSPSWSVAPSGATARRRNRDSARRIAAMLSRRGGSARLPMADSERDDLRSD